MTWGAPAPDARCGSARSAREHRRSCHGGKLGQNGEPAISPARRMFRPRLSPLIALILPLLAAGCQRPLDPVLHGSFGTLFLPDAGVPPPRIAQAAAPVPTLATQTVAAPAAEPSPPDEAVAKDPALALFQGDPLALRFVLLRKLAELELISADALPPRFEANKGALLLLTAPPPATGLNLVLPPVEDILARFRALKGGDGAEARAKAAERDFLLDALLPLAPATRTPLHPRDLVAARWLEERLNRLEQAGLITPEEKAAEAAALAELIASGVLPPVYVEPPPPKPQPKAVGRGDPARESLLRGWRVVPADTAPPPAPPGVPVGVQLLSMASGDFAKRAWEALVKEHPELKPLSYKAVRTDLGDLGVTWRLLAGPLDAEGARALCATLKGRGQTCLPTAFVDSK